MALSDLQQLNEWLENRAPLVREFEAIVRRQHKEPWPRFRVVGSTYDIRKGRLLPRYEGVPEGRVRYSMGEGPEWTTIVELAARITEVRSRRWYSTTQAVRPIPPNWQKLAGESFPFLRYMEIGSGWADLMIAMAGWMAEVGIPSGFRFSQVKEKFGTLSAYYDGPDHGVEVIIEAAERLSGCICDECGSIGKLRTGGWYATRCEDHV